MDSTFAKIIRAYKAAYPALDVVEMALGAPAQTDSTGAFWLCPFHADHSPTNFHVTKSNNARYPDTLLCFAGHCPFNRSGDIFDFLRALYGYGYSEAMDWIDGGRLRDSDEPQKLAVTHQAIKPAKEYVIQPPYSLDDAARFHTALREEHRIYYAVRGLTDDTIDRFRLGYDLETHRYVIPYFNTVGVYDFKRRRDDDWAMSRIAKLSDEYLLAEMNALWQKRLERSGDDELPPVPTVKDVLKVRYPKYIWGQAGQGVRWLFNEDRLIRSSDYALPYIFLTADEMSALSLEQEGYPAVCWSGDSAFPGAKDRIRYVFHGKEIGCTIRDVFRAAGVIYIVADGDVSGFFAAKKRQAALGRGEIVRVPVSEGIKDPNDLIARGYTISYWLPHVPAIL
jgi:hypothetical protein